jgi:hypothetical protein
MTVQCECPPGAGNATCELRVSGPEAPCPTNGQPGKRVDTITLKALLALPLTFISASDYRFCRDPQCPTVYYSADGSQLFTEADLREKVYQKHPEDNSVFVCYCFRHTLGDIRRSVGPPAAASVIDAINKGIQADKCACDIRNPQGSCCLGNVRILVKESGAATL